MTTDLARAVTDGQRAAVAQAITLVESRRADHREQAQRLLVDLLPHTGRAQRVGITGVPGVGKSTFIDQLGVNLIADYTFYWENNSPKVKYSMHRKAP